MEELISIVVPVYNVEQYIRKCLDSIRGQTYQNLEIILVDDGSTDRSREICDEYAKKDARFIVIHKENGGVLAARNTGIQYARGRYIGFVDADDWVAEQAYQRMYQEIMMHCAEIAICKKNIYDDETKSCFAESSILPEGGVDRADILHQLFVGGAGIGMGISLNLYDKLFARELIVQNYQKVDKRLHYFEDVSLAVLCILQAERIAICNQAFYFYRQRKESLCHSTDRMYLEQLSIFYQSVYLQIAESPKELFNKLGLYIADRAIYGLNHMMGLNLKHEIPYFIPPFQQLAEGDRVVLYGAGEIGKSFYRMFELARPGQIVLWVDRQYDKLQKEGIPVDSIEMLRSTDFDKIVIAVKFQNSAETIKRDLRNMGIMAEKMLWEQPATIIDV